jgi:hypothetical protein
VGTESSVFVSIAGGDRWVSLQNNLPTVPVHEIAVQPQKNDLVLGTYGRGFWIFDDLAILEELSEDVLASVSHLASVRPATQMRRYDRGRTSVGNSHFSAGNPPDGAIVTYYVNPAAMPREAGTPGSSGSAQPSVRIEILDASGAVVRDLEARQGAEGAGIQRVVWDLRHPLPFRPSPAEQESYFTGRLRGGLVMPGRYTVRLSVGSAQQTRTLDVQGDPLVPLTDTERRVRHDTQLALGQMLGTSRAAAATAAEVQGELRDIEAAVTARGAAGDTVLARLKELTAAVNEVRRQLLGDPAAANPLQAPGPPALAEQIRLLYTNLDTSLEPPTRDQLRLMANSKATLGAQVREINRLVDQGLPGLRDQLTKAGIQWKSKRQIAPVPGDPDRAPYPE